MQRAEVKHLSIFPQAQMIRCDRRPLRTKNYTAIDSMKHPLMQLCASPNSALSFAVRGC